MLRERAADVGELLPKVLAGSITVKMRLRQVEITSNRDISLFIFVFLRW
jgi:hypothetical protein